MKRKMATMQNRADGRRKRNDRSLTTCSQIEKEVSEGRRRRREKERDPRVTVPWEEKVRNKKGVVVTHGKSKERKKDKKRRGKKKEVER